MISVENIIDFYHNGTQEYTDVFYKREDVPIIIDCDGIIGKIDCRQRSNKWALINSRIENQYLFNKWIDVSSLTNTNKIIDKDQIVYFDQITINNCKYNGVELVNIDNVKGVDINHFKRIRNHNKDCKDLKIENFIRRLNIPVFEGLCNYPHIDDTINGVFIPCFQQYVNSGDFYQTLFHEFGHHYRYKINKIPFEVENLIRYCQEEIVVEISSMIICDQLNVNYNRNNSLAYIKDYIQQLFDVVGDKRLVDSDKRDLINNYFQHGERLAKQIMNDGGC